MSMKRYMVLVMVLISALLLPVLAFMFEGGRALCYVEAKVLEVRR